MNYKYPYNVAFIFVPILALILLILAYRKKEKILIAMNIKAILKFKFLKSILITLGLMLVVYSLTGPQTFQGLLELKKESLDIYILIDTSKSMLAEDIQPNRISRAKKIIKDIIDKLEGDRIGFIPFSSDAYIQMPLTDDYNLANMFLDVIDTNMIGGGGTNIEAAIKLAYRSFEKTASSDKVIIIISDGEEHETDSIKAAQQISDENFKIYTIGIGTEKGGLIPVYDDNDQKTTGYMKDFDGNFVTSSLYSDNLKKLAQIGNGFYYENDSSNLIKDMVSLKRSTTKTEKIRRYKLLYQPFLAAGILLFTIGYLLPERRIL